ncbi:MAG: OmpA family protein [Bacteroidales bacterium]|jgi:peptidoglycan-associated lipoprotein|nr:OmpA family protein [Bacteroidales bacterium]NLM91650.1 OmpA family protein [Bacteroidales bacterium]
MVSIKRTLFLSFFLFFVAFVPEAEGQERRVARADQAFEQHQYVDAIKLYRRSYNKVRRKNRAEAGRISFNTGVAYMRTNDPRRAEMQFKRAIRMNYQEPDAYLYLADALVSNEKFDEAAANYYKFMEMLPDDWRGPRGLETIEISKQYAEELTPFEVEAVRVFNSREDDFTSAWGDHLGNVLVFASSRSEAVGKDNDPWYGRKHTSLFVSYLDRAGKWSAPELLDEGPVNTEYNEGAPSTNSSGTELFFTRCLASENIEMGCRIFVSQRQGANWGEPSEVKLVTDSTVTVGHPAISNDELTLYFVSDMPGGMGGKDIWFARRRAPGDEFGPPQNMGAPINTPGNEMFPFIHEDGSLYFASDGHAGMGGLDIFHSEQTPEGWSKPENLGAPVNSPMDDFGMLFKPGLKQGFFSSNRRGSRGYDIHSFYLAPVEFTIAGTVKDDSTQAVLQGVTIQLVGSDGTLLQTETNDQGMFRFGKEHLKEFTSYEILANKNKYFSFRAQRSTEEYTRSHDFVVDINLEPLPVTPIALPEILYDFGRWELLPQFRDSLNGLVQTLNDNPQLVIELASHTDSRGTEASNDTLSQRRAQSVVEYLVEQGIDPARLEARGYGERRPRNLNRSITRDGTTFRAGVTLTEDYINRLSTERMREAAHALNRRTEFRILRDDFKPPENPEQRQPVRIDIMNEPDEDPPDQD